MNNPTTQAQINNARLIAVRFDAASERASLQFDRDVILDDVKLPIQFCDGTSEMKDVPPQEGWRKDAPGVISVKMSLGLGTGDSFWMFVPEQMAGLRSITGGRVLAAVMWGEAT